MTNAVQLVTQRFIGGAVTQPESAIPKPAVPGFGCVYVTASIHDAQQASALLEPVQIRIYHAASLSEAEALANLTNSRVLLTDTTFRRGTWRDVPGLAARLHPPAVLVVAAQLTDERLWTGVLEYGAYDLIQKPFLAEELRRVLLNAHSFAQSQLMMPLRTA